MVTAILIILENFKNDNSASKRLMTSVFKDMEKAGIDVDYIH